MDQHGWHAGRVLGAVMETLACPACRGRLHEMPGALRCDTGHAFDIARQGYVTLRAGGTGPRHAGDDAAMVTARHRVLQSGLYAGLAARVAAAAAAAIQEATADGVRAAPESGSPGGRPTGSPTGPRAPDAPGLRSVVVDAGGGTGYYVAAVLDHLRASGVGPPSAGVVLDASPYALRRAAAAHPFVAAVGCDLWQTWPLQDRTADVVLDVFSPRNGAEALRVLRPGGSLLVVTPAPEHLAQLVAPLALVQVDGRKPERVGRSLEPYLVRRSADPYAETIRLTHRDVATVVGMGPSARHVDAELLAARIATLPEPVEATLSVQITRWVRPADGH